MSLKAMVWALQDAPVPDNEPLAHLVLIALADNARDDGSAAWPSAQTLADSARCSKRTVRTKLQLLESVGLIRRGDQRLVDYLPGNRRPVVYDLAVCGVFEPVDNPVLGVQELHPYRGEAVSGVKETGVRGERDDALGVQPVAHKPSYKPSITQREITYVTTSSADEAVDNFPSHDSVEGVPAADAAADQTELKPEGNHPTIVVADEPSAREPAPESQPSAREGVPEVWPVCPAHRGMLAPPPCRACQRAREAWEAQALRLSRERAREARARERAELEAREERIAAARADPEVQAHIGQIQAGIRARFGRKVS